MSQDNFPNWFPDSHVENAETIRSYLISVRGGAPFLSGADCRLLIQWLDDEVPVPTILTTIDAVSAKRRQKRARSRLSLSICKGTLNKLIGKSNIKSKAIEQSGLEKWLEALMFMQVSDELQGAHRTLTKTVRGLVQTQALDHNQKASELISACRSFQDCAWECAFDDLFELQSAAEAELSELKSLLRGQAWKDAVEEVMRDHVRQRHPLVNAQAVWNALNQ